ncbi:MAG: MMPL family transporter [Planctomycetota bacterium]
MTRGRAFEAFAALGLRWPRLVVGLAIVLTALAVAELREFRLEPDISRLLPQGREVHVFRELEERTAGGRSLLVALHGRDLAEVEETLQTAADRLRGSPFLAEVLLTRSQILGGVAEQTQVSPLRQMDAATRDRLAARLTGERRAALERTLEDLASDPIGGRELAVNDPLRLREVLGDLAARALPIPLAGSRFVVLAGGETGVLRLVGRRPPYDADFARAMLADVEARLGTTTYDMWGGYVVAREQATRMQHDMMWSSISSSLLVGLYLAWALGSLLAAPLVLLPTVLAVVWALPLGGALFGPFNVIAVGAAAVLVGLGVDFGIHYLARYSAERQTAPHDAATRATARGIGLPVFLGALTTCGAFLSLTLGEFQGLAGFGVLLSLGLVLAMLLVFVLLPVMLRPERFAHLRPPRSRLAAGLERLAGATTGRVLGAVLLAAGLAGWILTAQRGVDFDVDADALSAKTSAAADLRVRIESMLGFSPLPTAILLDPDIEPATLADGLERLRAARTIAFADGPQRWLTTPQREAAVAAFHAETAGWVEAALRDLDELGFEPAEFEGVLRRFEGLLAADPGPVPARYQLDDRGRTRLVAFCYTPHTLRSEGAWHTFSDQVRDEFGTRAEPFGSFALLGEVRRLLLHDLKTCALATALLVVIVTLLMTRGHWLGWLALSPVVVGTGITLGLLAILDVPLNLANFVAVPFLLGIGVDDGIHVANHLRHAAPSSGLGDTGVAIWRTSATTALAFGSLMTSAMQGLWSLGLIALIGVLACYLASLFVMVPVVRYLRPCHGDGTG